MVDIVVIRSEGDRPGDDIQEPLLTDLGAALARGRAELDRASLHDELTLTCSYQPDVRCGDLVESYDADQGLTWRGKVTGITHRMRNTETLTTLRVWRPLT